MNRSMSFWCWGSRAVAVLAPGGLSLQWRTEAESPPLTCWSQCILQSMLQLACECTLPGHVEIVVSKQPQLLLLRIALNPSLPRRFVLRIAQTQVQDFALGLDELHKVQKPVKVHMDSIPSLQCVNPTTQLGVIRKSAESALNPIICVSYFTTVPKAQVQSCPVPGKKN